MRTQDALTATLAAAFLLAGCGGGGTSVPALTGGNGGNNGHGNQTQAETAVAGANALGSAVRNLASYNTSIGPPASGHQTGALPANGGCQNYTEFFAPDKNNDPNSTEIQYFYDQACTQLARDAVRLYSSTGSSSETVARTENLYALGNPSPTAARTDAIVISAATFGQYGYPIPADGFDRLSIDALNISGAKTIDSDEEFVMQPGVSSQAFCSDSAGFNVTGIPSLSETFGWQGGVPVGGSRTPNSDGSVTWAATHSGAAFKGAIGALSIATGATQNTSCPITSPRYTLSGGTQVGGAYSIPVTATYKMGLLVSLAVTNATLANGNTLNVTTNTSVPPTSNLFIDGRITNGGAAIATFTVDAFGDGTLTTASGAQFVITDWHVIR